MGNQTSYKLPQTGNEVKNALAKIPQLESISTNLNKEVQFLKQTMPTKTSDLKNDIGFVTKSDLEEVEAVAKGRASGYVFDTVDDMNIWLNNVDNVAQLKLGDNFYIRAVEVPDYWWDGSRAQELETQKVDLSEYEKMSNKKTSFSTSDIYDEESYPTVGAVAKVVIDEAIYTDKLIDSKVNEAIQSAILDSWEVSV